MKITDLFRQRALESESRVKSQSTAQNEAESTRRIRTGEDTVSISPLARQFSQISSILAEDEAAQRGKVEKLKRDVEAGTYLDSVSTRDVAESILSFAKDVTN